MNHLDWETTDDKFITAWQGLVRQSVYEQGQDLLAHAEWLQDGNARLNASRNESIKSVVFVVVAKKPTGQKHERIFTSQSAALSFAAEVFGQVLFSVDKDEFKVVWYDKEIRA